MGATCGKLLDDPPSQSISHYYTAQPQPPQPTAAQLVYAAAFSPTASPPAAAATSNTTTSSGIVIYPIYDDTASPIVSRRLDMSGFKVKTSFDAGCEATVNSSAQPADSTVDCTMLKAQMQVLSRLKSHSKSGRQSEVDNSGTTAGVSRTDSPTGFSEVKTI